MAAQYTDTISKNLDNVLTETDLGIGKKYVGKVRDRYDLGETLVLVTTDRQSAFDRLLASVPFKGQVLNQTSAWWFERTKHIVPNHVISIPDPNVTIAKKYKVIPVEFVMRSYLTGSTSTSIWTHYEKGERNFCGNKLPDGMVKNQPLGEETIITPSTKSDERDESVSPQQIIDDGLMTKEDWERASKIAKELFAFGQKTAAEHGLILVDTKYELGMDTDGTIVLIDEIHTPDSSRYWIADSYEERFRAGKEPENIDKEFLRLWFKDNSDPYKDDKLPEAPKELVVELSRRYIQLYEMITGQTFEFPDTKVPVNERITQAVEAAKIPV